MHSDAVSVVDQGIRGKASVLENFQAGQITRGGNSTGLLNHVHHRGPAATAATDTAEIRRRTHGPAAIHRQSEHTGLQDLPGHRDPNRSLLNQVEIHQRSP